MFGSAESQVPKLITVKLFLQNSNACDHNPLTLQTDGQTTYHGITALRYASRGKKLGNYLLDDPIKQCRCRRNYWLSCSVVEYYDRINNDNNNNNNNNNRYFLYTVWVKKFPLRISDYFFPKGWKFLVQILRTYYTFLSTLDYRFY